MLFGFDLISPTAHLFLLHFDLLHRVCIRWYQPAIRAAFIGTNQLCIRSYQPAIRAAFVGTNGGAKVVQRWCIGIVVQRCCRCMCRGGAGAGTKVVQESRGGPGAGVGPQSWC